MTHPLLIISGGQTGVDRAALDAALAVGIEIGGWCPAGRWAEDGPIPCRYLLRETASSDPAERTRLNVRDSDATLVLTLGPPRGGTALTLELANALRRPHQLVDLNGSTSAAQVADWIRQLDVQVLNVAGPRASEAPGIYIRAFELVREILATASARQV
ncbi:MAG: putative molybdenum carrier protein [Bacteroidota bacterium]